MTKQTETFKTQQEQRDAFFESMYVSTLEKVVFWESMGFTRGEAIAKARAQSCAGARVWAQIEDAR